jgi:hypothetical protein
MSDDVLQGALVLLLEDEIVINFRPFRRRLSIHRWQAGHWLAAARFANYGGEKERRRAW